MVSILSSFSISSIFTAKYFNKKLNNKYKYFLLCAPYVLKYPPVGGTGNSQC